MSVARDADSLAEQIEARIKTLRRSTTDETRKRMITEAQELSARKLLAVHEQKVLEHIERRKKYAAYGLCTDETKTRRLRKRVQPLPRQPFHRGSSKVSRTSWLIWQAADKLFRGGHQNAYEKEAKYLYGTLREAWERALEKVLLGGIVERFRPGVQTQHISAITDITSEDCRTLDAAMTKCSRMATRPRRGSQQWLSAPGAQGNDSNVPIVNLPPSKSNIGWDVTEFRDRLPNHVNKDGPG